MLFLSYTDFSCALQSAKVCLQGSGVKGNNHLKGKTHLTLHSVNTKPLQDILCQALYDRILNEAVSPLQEEWCFAMRIAPD